MFLDPTIEITIYSIIIIIVINVFYKILIKQDEAKNIKDRQKQMRDEMKKYQKEGNTEKTKQLMGEMMSENSKLMKMTMKPMIISFAIVIIILPMINGVYGDKMVPIENGTGIFKIDGTEYQVSINEKTVSITGQESFSCETPCREKFMNATWNINSAEKNVVFGRVMFQLPVALPYVGDDLGWLGWYIIVSIPVMIIFRRGMKIHI
jgi:uncharacterized membrane protein (DUF106 family)